VLALLLARKGVSVVLLEEHQDFDRDFRGDTLHPSVMEIMDQLGLADRLLQLPHSKLNELRITNDGASFTFAIFGRLRTRFPFITMLPQARFLEFITAEAARYPCFHLILGANVQELIVENGATQGVRYRAHDGWHEVRGLLTVAADGRFSRIRALAGLRPIKTSPPIDVLWFRLPRRPGDPTETLARTAPGAIFGLINRDDTWQAALVIAKGSYQRLREAGLAALRHTIVGLEPFLADRIDQLQDWKQVSLLSVESNRLPRWYKPGLLLIGDAAHVMSPVGGVGINYAIQDAVVAANVLVGPLKAGRVVVRDLAAVQRQRIWPTRIIQAYQNLVQQTILASVVRSDRGLNPPPIFRLLFRIPFIWDLPARFVAFGITRVRVEE
jgi:2-polyprenyl-6-methoxyphenol hydroxylase-like FAD-dependent oxidoreductase